MSSGFRGRDASWTGVAESKPHPGMATWKQLLVLGAVAALPSAFLLAAVPPIWPCIDPFVLCVFPMSNAVPHFPPLYPLFTRVINYVTMYGFYSRTGDLHPILQANLNTVGLYTIITLQHVLGVGALVTFAIAAARTLRRRLAVLAVLLLNPVFSVCFHSVMTEGLWFSFLVYYLAAALRVWRADGLGSPMAHLACFVSLLLAILTRHPGVVLAGLLPGLLILGFLWLRTATAFKKLALASTCALLAVATAQATTARLCKSCHVEYRNVWGKAGCYRVIASGWKEVSATERQVFADELRARTRDPSVARAIPVVLDSDLAWVPTFAAVQKSLAEDGRVPSDAQVDRVLNEVCWLVVSSGHPRVIESMESDYKKYLLSERLDGVLHKHLCYWESTGPLVDEAPSYREATKHCALFDPANRSEYVRQVDRFLARNIGSKIAPFRNAHILLLIAAGGLLAFVLNCIGPRELLFVLAGLSWLLLYLGLMCVVTVYVARYGYVVAVVGYPLAGVVVGSIRRPTRRVVLALRRLPQATDAGNTIRPSAAA
jgi:hypothetical protein